MNIGPYLNTSPPLHAQHKKTVILLQDTVNKFELLQLSLKKSHTRTAIKQSLLEGKICFFLSLLGFKVNPLFINLWKLDK